MKPEKCERIALGGVFSSLCLLLMFLASVVPFASIAMPMLAGAALTVVVIENGTKTAVLVYVAVSLLSVFMVPELDAKLLFITFFGYYSALKPAFEKLAALIQYAVKLSVFNSAMVISYYLSIAIAGVDKAIDGLFGQYGPLLFLLGINILFFLYDFLITRYIRLYLNWFKPTFLRR